MILIYAIDIVATLIVVYLALRGGIERALPAFCFILVIVPSESVIHLGDWFALTVDRILIVVLVALYFLLRSGAPRLAGVGSPIGILIVFHIIWSAISTAHSVVPLISFKAATAQAVEYYVIYFIFTHSLTTTKTIYRIIGAVVAAVAICSVIGAYEAYTSWVMVQSWFPPVEYRFYATFADIERGARGRASFPHPILLGSAIALAIPMALYLLTVVKQRLQRILLWIGTMVMFMALYKTMSRGPWLALGISLAVLLLCGARMTRKHILAIIGLALFVLITRPGVWDTLSSLYTSTLDPETPAGMSYYYRYSLYDAAFKAVNMNVERQLWGYGPESFYYLHLVGKYMGKPTKIDSCDSAWVEIMVDTGYVGLALSVAIMFVPAFFALKNWLGVKGRDRHLLLLILVNMLAYYFMMIGVMLYGWGQQTYILWFLISISVVYPAILKQNAKRHAATVAQTSPPHPREALSRRGVAVRATAERRIEGCLPMSATLACETMIPAAREGKLTVSVFRTPEEIGRFETWWRRWQYHPNADPDFFWTIVRSRSQVLYPFVLVVARDGSPEAMLIGRRRSDTK